MIYLILGFLIIITWIFFVRGAWINGNDYNSPHSFWYCGRVLIVTTMICILPVMVIYVQTLFNSTTKIIRSSERSNSLVGLKDLTSREGHLLGGFFLGIGVISGSEKDVYKIRYATSQSGIMQIKTLNVDANDVYFVEDGLNKLVVTNSYTERVFTDMGKKLFWSNNPNIASEYKGTTYTFHVPKGSIFSEFNVDLE